MYVICHDDPTNGEFQSDNSHSNKLENALRKVSLNVELLQTFISETMNKHFQRRKTFVLKTDLINEQDVICEPYYTRMSVKQALSSTSSEIFLHLAEEIKKSSEIFDPNCKYIAVLSFTRYVYNSNQIERDMFANTKGYCAMGI